MLYYFPLVYYIGYLLHTLVYYLVCHYMPCNIDLTLHFVSHTLPLHLYLVLTHFAYTFTLPWFFHTPGCYLWLHALHLHTTLVVTLLQPLLVTTALPFVTHTHTAHICALYTHILLR